MDIGNNKMHFYKFAEIFQDISNLFYKHGFCWGSPPSEFMEEKRFYKITEKFYFGIELCDYITDRQESVENSFKFKVCASSRTALDNEDFENMIVFQTNCYKSALVFFHNIEEGNLYLSDNIE